MSVTQYGELTLDVLGGVGALLVGVGIFVATLALAKTLADVRTTLDEVVKQLEGIGAPLTSTLTNVDQVTKSLEEATGSLARTADLTKSAVSPAIINVGVALSGITAGLRRLATGKDSNNREQS